MTWRDYITINTKVKQEDSAPMDLERRALLKRRRK